MRSAVSHEGAGSGRATCKNSKQPNQRASKGLQRQVCLIDTLKSRDVTNKETKELAEQVDALTQLVEQALA
jgi:hypothetical protein